jgi:SH3 domain protein
MGMHVKTIISIVLLVISLAAQAQISYVTDEFKITMRSGESAKHRVVQMIKSGTPVTVLSVNKDTGYSEVRTGSGKTGYVLSRHLLNEPVAREQLASLQARIEILESAPGELSSKLAKLSKEYELLNQTHNAMVTEKEAFAQELEELKRVSANAVEINRERKTLRKQVATMSHDVEDQQQEIRELKNSAVQRWFLIGAGVLLGGIVLGLILPHLRIRKRKDSWGSL